MTTTSEPYLEAKRAVDDRALHRRVLERFAAELSSRQGPVRIVELGAGVGTMIVRLVEWELLPPRISYRAVDTNAARIERARELVPERLEAAGYRVEPCEPTATETVAGGIPKSTTLAATRTGRTEGTEEPEYRLNITLEVADALAIEDAADAVVAAAWLDIVDMDAALAAIADLLADEGFCYAPITYNGRTAFAPRDPLDESIEAAYHRHMDAIRDGGSSRTGSELLAAFPRRGWDVLASGGSDWVVRPVDGSYHHADRVVVDHVLETMADALEAVPTPEIAPDERTRWLDRRRRELEDSNLVYVAHNLDVLVRLP